MRKMDKLPLLLLLPLHTTSPPLSPCRVCKNATAAEVQEKLKDSLKYFAPNNNYKKVVSDRGSETARLGERLGLTHYHIQQGPWRKVSIGIDSNPLSSIIDNRLSITDSR